MRKKSNTIKTCLQAEYWLPIAVRGIECIAAVELERTEKEREEIHFRCQNPPTCTHAKNLCNSRIYCSKLKIWYDSDYKVG